MKTPKKRKSRLKSKERLPIHPSIKMSLGYARDEPDKEVLQDWKARLRRVCKPCWELKYCPYGPLVEQSPLLPIERSDATTHIDRLKRMLDADQLGELEEISPERRRLLKEWINDGEILRFQALHELKEATRTERIAASQNPEEETKNMWRGDLPPIHEYRVPFDILSTQYDVDDLSADQKRMLKKKISERKKALVLALKTGIEDNRKPLDKGRRAVFEEEVRSFRPEDHPEHIPSTFHDGECNFFGHICPVFFAAEVITETSTERRRGRYIPFTVKMRIVRRDNHTCQHCGKHLADYEVEFDHKIPISKGGSSEEHNFRLTCFDCNRDKRDSVDI